jgi:hypothetical protein
MICSKREGAGMDQVFPMDYYLKLGEEYNIKFAMFYDTHQHSEHISAAKELADKAGVDLYIGSYDE